MKLAVGFGWLLITASSFCAGCAPVSHPHLSSNGPGQDEVRARTVQFSQAIIEASRQGWSPDSVARIADFYAIDAVVFPPRGEPLRGREAQSTYWSSRERLFLTHSTTAERVDVSGDLATEWGTLTITSKQGSAAAAEGRATYISIWTKRDGVWRKQMDTWW